MSNGARLGHGVLQKGLINESEAMHGVVVNEVLKPAMMGGA